MQQYIYKECVERISLRKILMEAKSRLCRSRKAAQRLDRICLVTLIDVATRIIEKELWKFKGHGKSLKLRINDERKHRLLHKHVLV